MNGEETLTLSGIPMGFEAVILQAACPSYLTNKQHQSNEETEPKYACRKQRTMNEDLP